MTFFKVGNYEELYSEGFCRRGNSTETDRLSRGIVFLFFVEEVEFFKLV